MDFKVQANDLRGHILAVDKTVLDLKTAVSVKNPTELSVRPGVPPDAAPADKGEMLANIVLAHRHLEDARMRLGKAIQAYDGGVSVYDRKATP